MPRMTRVSKFRLPSAIIGIVFLAILAWPAASLWVSYGQTPSVEASASGSAAPRDMLTKMLAGDSRAAFNGNRTGNFLLRSQIDETANLLVPNMSATKVDTVFTDVDGDGRADPGDTLQYTITISNTGAGATDATSVKFSDVLDANLTLVGGSLNSSPIAFDDSGYTATGNVRISISAVNGVLVNDIDPDTLNNTGLTASAGATSANGGNVVMAANGSFSYNPPAGFTGTDTFTYTVTDTNGATGTGTVTFNVSGMIWFVQAGAPAGGNGRLTNPINCLVGAGCFDAVAADDPGDNIFLYTGAYTGGLTLLANQRVIGQGAGASISTITGITPPTGSDALPSTGGARPTITTTIAATSAITVGSGNTLRGFDIGNTTAVDITGTSFGTLTILEMTLGGTGRLLNLTTGTLAATFDNLQATSAAGGPGLSLTTVGGTLTVSGTTSITSASGQGITIGGSSVAANFGTSTTITDPGAQGILVSTSTGNISFGNTTVSDATDSISLISNSAGTRSFGTITTTNGSGAGFLHSTAGGLVTVSGATSITNPTGRGIDIQDSTTSITFANANVTQSGGVGVFIDDTSGVVTFGDLDISPDAAQRGLHVTDQTGTLTTTSGVITSTTTGIPVEIVGVSAANRTPLAMVLETVNANGAANGIVLTSTSGTFAVNGTGTTLGSGGTIQNITNRGASFIDANGITLKNMNLTNVGTTNGADPTNPNSTCGGQEVGLGGNLGCNAGIHLVNVTGATFDRVVLNGGVQQGINMNNVTTFAMSNSSVLNFGDQTREDGLRITNLLGTNSISSTTVTGNEENQMRVVNTSGTLTAFNITGSTFSTSAPPNGTDGIQFEGTGTAIMNINVSSSTMSGNAADGFFSSGTDTSTVNVRVTGCTFNNNLNAAVNVNIVSGASGIFNILNNPTMTNMGGNVINVNVGAPSTGTLQGTISGNSIGTNGVAGSGSNNGGTGIRLVTNGAGNLNTVVSNNTIRGISLGSGIDVLARDGSSDINATITGNNIDTITTTGSNGIIVQSGATATDTTNVCADIGGSTPALRNTIANQPVTALDELRVRNRFPGTLFRLPGYAGGGADTAAVITYLQGRNSVAAGGTTSATINGNTFTGGAACIQPPAPRMAGEEFDASLMRPSNAPASDQSATGATSAALSSELMAVTWQPTVEFNETTTANQPAVMQARANRSTATSADTSQMFLSHARKTATRLAIKVQDERLIPQDESRKKGKRSNGDLQPSENQGEEEGTDGSQTVSVGGANGFTLPAGKTTTIIFRVTIDSPLPSMTQVSNQGIVTADGGVNVVTNDPDTGTANDPTITPIDHTTVAVTSNANPAVFGQNVTFTATLTGVPVRASDPPGTVQFKADGNNIGSPVPVVVGTVGDNVSTAQVSISSLSVGSHVITAEYSGGGAGALKYNANIGTLSGGQVVGKANTTTGVTSSQNPSVFGQQVTFTATIAPVAPGAGSPTGTVNFLDGGNPIASCQNVALAAGQATCQTSALAVGNHTISVAYGGDTNFNTSNGNMTGNPQVVNKAGTSVGLTSSQNPSVFGQAVTFTATVAVTAPGAGTPTGTVTFLDGGNPIAGCTNVALQTGQAQCQPASLSVGNHTITVTYSGDGNFNTANGSLTGNPQVVNKANTTVGLTSSQNPATLGTNISFTATIGVTAPGAGSPSGTVQFLDGGNPIAGCTAVAVAAGQAVCQTTALTAGNHTITAVYSGDGNFNTSNGSLTGNPQVITGPPGLTPTVGLTRTQGSPTSNSQIATVSDDVSSPGNVTVTAITVPAGINITNIVNANGTITANIEALCNAATGNNTIVLEATDGKGLDVTANLVINVQPNTAPTLGNYANQTVVTGCKLFITPDAAPADNGSVASVMAAGSMGFTGTITVDAASGLVTIDNNNPLGTHTITVTATDNCGATFQRTFTVQVNPPPTLPTEYDFDGDRKADVSVYRAGATPSDMSHWFVLRSTDNTLLDVQFGNGGDSIVPGDYDGDGDTDVAVFRPSNNMWFTSTNPANNYGAVQWGSSGDIPVPGFYDADNKTDVAVYRPSMGAWYIRRSSDMGMEVRSWGQSGDKVVPADYDGDGKTDLAVWRPSEGNWYIQNSGGGTTVQSWGVSTDFLVPADYDGDGKDDIAIFRPSTAFWHIRQSSGGTRAEEWGETGDVPAPADFDNDGKADLSVYRPSEGGWYIFRSCPCSLRAEPFGITTDMPVPAAFTPPTGP